MKAMTIRAIPDDLYRLIAARAKRNRRSLQQEAMVLLERARAFELDDAIAHARRLRVKLQGRALGDTVSEIREERAR